MSVDSFKFLPRIIAAFYQLTDRQPQHPIPWTPLEQPANQSTFGLVTSGGFYLKASQPPFDLEREKAEPRWGDPGYRAIPSSVEPSQLGVSHLHLNTADLEADFNILLPIQRMLELEAEGMIGGLAGEHYSFMGFQGYPPDTSAWESDSGQQVAGRLLHAGVQAVLLTPA